LGTGTGFGTGTGTGTTPPTVLAALGVGNREGKAPTLGELLLVTTGATGVTEPEGEGDAPKDSEAEGEGVALTTEAVTEALREVEGVRDALGTAGPEREKLREAEPEGVRDPVTLTKSEVERVGVLVTEPEDDPLAKIEVEDEAEFVRVRVGETEPVMVGVREAEPENEEVIDAEGDTDEENEAENDVVIDAEGDTEGVGVTEAVGVVTAVTRTKIDSSISVGLSAGLQVILFDSPNVKVSLLRGKKISYTTGQYKHPNTSVVVLIAKVESGQARESASTASCVYGVATAAEYRYSVLV